MDIYEGAELPPLARAVVQENIDSYAEASRDFNPIHIDEEYAKNTPQGFRGAVDGRRNERMPARSRRGRVKASWVGTQVLLEWIARDATAFG